jgi:hypothetical protein
MPFAIKQQPTANLAASERVASNLSFTGGTARSSSTSGSFSISGTRLGSTGQLGSILGSIGGDVFGGGFQIGGGGTPAGGGGQPAQPAAGGFTINTSNLLALANLIPIAQDGQIITSDHHNTIRTALLALIAGLGGTPSAATATVSVAPAFFTDGTQTNWQVSMGIASKPQAAPAVVSGWVPIELPDQMHIQSMNVIGSRTGTIPTLEFDLIRQPFTDTTTATLISISGDGTTTNPFGTNTAFDPTNLTAATIEDLTRVDNSKYKYIIHALMRGVDQNATVQILTLQVICG